MHLLITSLAPLSATLTHAPRPVRAIPDFLAAGHTISLAAPLAGHPDEMREALNLRAVLPLHRVELNNWGTFLLNAYRLSHWSRRWAPDLYLSDGAQSAMLAHGGRGAAGGYGLSVLFLPTLRYPTTHRLGHRLERRAIHECDRLVTDDPGLAQHIVAHHGARGGDLTLLSNPDTSSLVTLCERYLTEPPRPQ